MPFSELTTELTERTAAGLLRRRRLLESPQGTHVRVDGREVLSFCSNDYLGLANHPALISAAKEAADSAGVGGGASHLITGHHHLHQKLEEALAKFVGLPFALLFSTGYMANIGVVTALVGRSDTVFADKLNHASLNDAAVLSKSRTQSAIRTMTWQRWSNCSRRRKSGRKLVLADAVFSMDGDVAPVKELLALCETYDAWLMLDDAHGFGVLGNGRGILAEHGVCSPRIIYMATLGKAAGVAGAFVAGETMLIENLIQ